MNRSGPFATEVDAPRKNRLHGPTVGLEIGDPRGKRIRAGAAAKYLLGATEEAR
jgi:hypothetical protein